MRNLKKILALVLALVMSLSLMATAGAADASAASTDKYATAKDVLEGLEVFRGDEGGMRYDASITRAETAALVYRIATSDVKDTQVGLYTNHPFTDLASVQAWATGYIAYGYNAEILKGNGDGTFSPNDPVTGYATLAMILRTMGYGRNHEFEGENWEIQTAATAKQEGLLNGVTAADEAALGQPAQRGLVAQILFNALLQPTAKYSALNPYNYTKDAETLGYQKFKLEEITGVVTANEYANLGDNELDALAAGRTQLTTGSEARTLNVVSYFSDIGEARTAYIVPDTQRTYKVLCGKLFDAGNVTVDNGYGAKGSSDLNKDVSLITDSTTEHYVNYDKAVEHTANIRLGYYVKYDVNEEVKNLVTEEQWDYLLDSKNTIFYNAAGETITANIAANAVAATHWIQPDEKLTEMDEDIIKAIFYNADLYKNANQFIDAEDVVKGEVYVGTQSTVDYSDTKSMEQFYKDNTTASDKEVTSAGNGEWLKIIDNDGDGVADYVLKTEYILAEVVSKVNDSTYYRGIPNGSTVKYEANGGEVYGDTVELAVSDVVLTTDEIDGSYYAEVVTPVTATIKTVVYATPEVTTTEDVKYGESDITNRTVMDENIIYMGEKVAYNLYLDKGGFIRAYKLVDGSKYALLTEMYPTGNYNGAYVTRTNWIVEMMRADDARPAEYNLLNSYVNTVENPFIDNQRDISNIWNGGVIVGAYRDYLQEAIAHLNIEAVTASMNPNAHEEFDWDEADDNWETGAGIRQSMTNVGRYVMGEDGVYLYSASELAYRPNNHEQVYYANGSNNGAHTWRSLWLSEDRSRTDADWAAHVRDNNLIPVYANDYVQLSDDENIAAGARMYKDCTPNRDVVYAVNDTQYYLVTTSGIRTFVGYSNVPSIKAENIDAIYAVAQNTTATSEGLDYWVADVIVIELNANYNYESISLIYNNPSQTTAITKALDTLNNKASGVKQGLYPDGYVWGNQWGAPYTAEYGFYGLTSTTASDTENAVNAKIERITKGHYNDNGIYAGTVVAIPAINNRGYYISVDTNGDNYPDKTLTVYSSANGQVPVYAIGRDGSNYGYTARNLVIDDTETVDNRLLRGHEIVWVENGADNIAFIVAVNYTARNWTGASFLSTEWDTIWDEQNPAVGPDEYVVDTTDAMADIDAAYDEAVAAVDAAIDAGQDVDRDAMIAELEDLRAAAKAAVNAAARTENTPEAIEAAEAAVAGAAADGVQSILDAVAGLGGDMTDVEIAQDEVNEAIDAARDALAAAVADGRLSQEDADILEAELDAIDPSEIDESNLDTLPNELLDAIAAIVEQIPDEPVIDPAGFTVSIQYFFDGEESDAYLLEEGEYEQADENTITIDTFLIEVEAFDQGETEWTVTGNFDSYEAGEDVYTFTFEEGIPEEVTITVDVVSTGAEDPDDPDNPGPGDDEDGDWEDILSASTRRSARALSGRAADTKLIGRKMTTAADRQPTEAARLVGGSRESGFTIVGISFLGVTTSGRYQWYITATIDAGFQTSELKVTIVQKAAEVDPENPAPDDINIPVVIAAGEEYIESVVVNGETEVNDLDTVHPGDEITVTANVENAVIKINNVERDSYTVAESDKAVKIEVTAEDVPTPPVDPDPVPVSIVLNDETESGKELADYVDIKLNDELVESVEEASEGDRIEVTAKPDLEGVNVTIEPAAVTVLGTEEEITITVTVKTAVDVPVTVSATAGEAAATLVLVDGEGNETSSYRTTSANGKVVITAKLTNNANQKAKPVVTISGEDIVFTYDETARVWTGEIPVTATTRTISVTAKQYFTVTLTKAAGIMGLAPITFDGEVDNKVSADIFKDSTETLEFPFTVNETNAQPAFEGSVSSATAAIEQKDGKWVASFKSVTGNVNAQLKIVDNVWLSVAPAAGLTLVDEDLAKGPVQVTDGKYEIVVDAPVGFQPKIGSKYFELADAETYGAAAEGKVRWVSEITVTSTTVANIASEEQVKATVTSESAAVTIPTATAHVVKLPTQGYTVTFTGIEVRTSFTLTGEGVTCADTGKTTEDGRSNIWTVTKTVSESASFETPITVSVSAVTKQYVRLTAESNSGIVVESGDSFVGVTDSALKTDGSSVSYAKFTLTVPAGQAPNVESNQISGAAVRFIPGEGNTWEAWVAPAANTANTTVTVGAVTMPQLILKNETNRDVIDISGVNGGLPIISMVPSAMPLAESSKDSTNWNWDNVCPIIYTAEVSGIKMNMVTDLSVDLGQDTKATKTLNPESASDSYTLTISTTKEYKSTDGNITAELSANAGKKVEVAVAEDSNGKIDLTGVTTSQYVAKNETLTFDVTLTEAAGENATVNAAVTEQGAASVSVQHKSGNVWTVTVRGVTNDATITLSVATANAISYLIEIASDDAKGFLDIPRNGTSTNGVIELEAEVAAGYTVDAKVYSGQDELQGVTPEVKRTGTTSDVWTITVKDIPKGVEEVTIKLKSVKDEGLKIDVKAARIWNTCYTKVADGEHVAVTDNRITDTGDASGLYENYSVTSSGLRRDANGDYEMDVTLTAEGIIQHWNGAQTPALGWWSGICLQIDGVETISKLQIARGNNQLTTWGESVTLSNIQYEGDDGKAASINNAVGLYFNANQPTTITVVANYEKGNVSYKVTFNVTCNVTEHAVHPYVWQMEGNLVTKNDGETAEAAALANFWDDSQNTNLYFEA